MLKHKHRFKLVCTSSSGIEVIIHPIEPDSTPEETWNEIIKAATDTLFGGDFFVGVDDGDHSEHRYEEENKDEWDAKTESEAIIALPEKLATTGKFCFPGAYLDAMDGYCYETLTLELVVGTDDILVSKSNFADCWKMCTRDGNPTQKKATKK